MGRARMFRAVKLLCRNRQWYIRVTTHLCKPAECKIPGENPKADLSVGCL